MGAIAPPRPVLALLAAFSRHRAALEWARQRAERHWGPVALASEVFPFTRTTYYEASMGSGLWKVFWAFQNRIDPTQLVERKLTTNHWEQEFVDEHDYAEPRPLNLDPGYLTEAKLVLATTKDRDHRIYLGRGIYAEVTLHYHAGAWQPRAWTYPDYRQPEYHAFFLDCRRHLRG